jgi:hypothetical protein
VENSNYYAYGFHEFAYLVQFEVHTYEYQIMQIPYRVFPLRVQVKPCIVQINLATCCVVPPDLQEYAKLNDILLLTHNDPRGKSWQSWVCTRSSFGSALAFRPPDKATYPLYLVDS